MLKTPNKQFGMWISQTFASSFWHKYLMNLDAVIEDLEAQAYFASNQGEDENTSIELCKLVLVVRKNLPDVYLSMPLLGKGFIAGFKVSNTKSSWHVFQEYLYLEPKDHGTKLQRTKVSLQELVTAHLIGTSVKLSLSANQSELSGYLVSVSGRHVEFVTLDAMRLWIPIKRIRHMVVEKLSM
jgi:hypothetical protein